MFILNPAVIVIIFFFITGGNSFERLCYIFVVSPVFAPDINSLERHLAAFAEIGTFSDFEFFKDNCRFVVEKDDFG